MENLVTVSAFSSPILLWPLLESGASITFKEYSGTGIPPDHFVLNDLDLNGRWKSYSRSAQGLQEALADNARRLIEWKYSSWFGSSDSFDERLHAPYSMLVQTYCSEICSDLSRYFGINRTIEAGACYAHFLADESALLGCFKYGRVFDWAAAREKRAQPNRKPEPDTSPFDHSTNSDIIEQAAGYIVQRKRSKYSGSGHRNTVVEITDVVAVPAYKIAEWLNVGHRVEYGQKTLFEPEEDGTVFGTDAYGLDFYAGRIDEPNTIIRTIQENTYWENIQEGD